MSGPVCEAADETWRRSRVPCVTEYAVYRVGRLCEGFLPRTRVPASSHARTSPGLGGCASGANRETGRRWILVRFTAWSGENWQAIDRALRAGSRGLPGGSSLAMLLDEQRGPRPNPVGDIRMLDDHFGFPDGLRPR